MTESEVILVSDTNLLICAQLLSAPCIPSRLLSSPFKMQIALRLMQRLLHLAFSTACPLASLCCSIATIVWWAFSDDADMCLHRTFCWSGTCDTECLPCGQCGWGTALSIAWNLNLSSSNCVQLVASFGSTNSFPTGPWSLLNASTPS